MYGEVRPALKRPVTLRDRLRMLRETVRVFWANLRSGAYLHARMARYLERRGWVVFYLEPLARDCGHGVCWLQEYQRHGTFRVDVEQ